MLNHPVENVNISDNENIKATYMAGLFRDALHLQAAKDFMAFLATPQAKKIYKK